MVRVIGLIQINNANAFDAYRDQVGATIALYGGEILARGSVLETPWNELNCDAFEAIVELQFPSVAAAKAWIVSPEYAQLLDIRSQAMRLTLFSVV
jgi:uncharacterized protein (DUF1330 family)